MTQPITELDLRTRLPRGLSAVEASAGTGKTYALTALAVHGVVLDGVRTDQLLVVTFTRAAANELRGRVRGGLRDAAVTLRTLVSSGQVPPGLPDWLDALCRTGGAPDDPPAPPEEALRRATAAAVALSTLDRATITTLHGFCQAALTQLGLRGAGVGTRLTTDVRRLRTDVVRDRLLAVLDADPDALRRSKGKGDSERLETPREVEKRVDQLVNAVLASDAFAAPIGPATEPVAVATARFTEDVIGELRSRLASEGELTFDELIRRMDLTLDDERDGPVAARQLRERLRLVLVDEMQDTDAVQWRILERAFLSDPAQLGPASDVVIVGDPKQSIYRFRGADIDAYLAASAAAGAQQRSLGQNWRSSAPLLEALDVLMRGAQFGGSRIAYHSVRAGHPVPSRVTGTGAPLELRWIRRDGSLPLAQDGYRILTDGGDARVLDDLAAHVVGMLRTGRIVASDADRSDPTIAVAEDGTRALAPRDLAVLVRKNDEATAVVERLAAAGVPAVQPKGGRVYTTEAFVQWRMLLAALARPSDTDLVRALLLSWFVAAAPDAVDDDAQVERLHETCVAWRSLLASDGVMALLAALRADERVAGALARAGERGLTDVEHLAELVHVAVGARGVPAAVALRTLEELALASDRGEDDTDDPSVRRIGSDGDAAEVMTYHAAKGLEFPVVLLPYANRSAKLYQPWAFRSTVGRVVDAGSGLDWAPLEAGDGSPDAAHARKKDRQQAARDEQAGDEARLLYVALTRARDRCTVWWWPVSESDKSHLATLLFADRDANGALVTDAEAPKLKELDDATTADRLGELAERANATIEVVAVPAAVPDVHYAGVTVAAREGAATATLGRDIHEPDVWRWSFTGLLRPPSGTATQVSVRAPAGATPAGVPAGVLSEERITDVDAPARGGTDEPDVPTLAASEGSGDAATAVPDERAVASGLLVDLPGGTAFGVLVHEALEVVDLAAPPDLLEEALRRELTLRVSRAALTVDVPRLASGLVAAARTPIEPLAPGLRLCDVPASDRIHELVFELPVADTRSRVLLGDLADAVAGALTPDDPYRDAFATLPDRVERTRLAGWLTGVVDLALRLPDGRYVVADHKTNRLSDVSGRPAYDRDAMHAAMLHGEYPLQALLYLVGMHRVLGRRLAGYDPVRHLGGAAFLFLRGMVGEATPLRDGVRDGVCVWRPETAAVLAADAILSGASAPAGRRGGRS